MNADSKTGRPLAYTAASQDGEVYSTASRKRYDWKRKALFAVATPLLSGAFRFVYAAGRVRSRPADDAPGALDEFRAHVAGGAPCLPCFWHQHLLPAAGFLCDERAHGLRPCWLISPSLDAEVPARIAARWGLDVVRGSGTRTGARALLALRRAVREERLSAVLTPDGPKGPPHEARGGPLKLAQISGAPILPLGIRARRVLRLPTWDRIEVPVLPLRVDVVVGPLLHVPREADGQELERLRLGLERRLRELDRSAAN